VVRNSYARILAMGAGVVRMEVPLITYHLPTTYHLPLTTYHLSLSIPELDGLFGFGANGLYVLRRAGVYAEVPDIQIDLLR